MRKGYRWTLLFVLLLAAYVLARSIFVQDENREFRVDDLVFSDARKQASQFIAYYHSIPLTPSQEEIKEEALSIIPAPCCSDYSVATCCCPCNLAKSVWGLSHFLIAERNYNAQQVQRAVEQWTAFMNPGGYSGRACYDRRCNQPFLIDGCGGMDERRIL